MSSTVCQSYAACTLGTLIRSPECLQHFKKFTLKGKVLLSFVIHILILDIGEGTCTDNIVHIFVSSSVADFVLDKA